MSASQVTDRIRSLAAYLSAHDNYLLTTHLTPDGDGLGSQLALYRVLKAMGKTVQILNCSSVPADLRFMVRSGEIITYRADKHEEEVKTVEHIIAFDLGGAGRLGRMEKPVRQAKGKRILIDHHIFDDELFTDGVVAPDRSSSAEITFELIRAMKREISREIAEPLYVGIVQDTGSFNYNTTNHYTHLVASELLQAGVNPHRIWKKLNCQQPFKRMRLLGQNLSRIDMSACGRVARVKVSLQFLKECDGEVRDAFEVVNYLLNIDGVEVGLLGLQIGTDRTKFSLRSSGRCDVFSVATSFGGGGHRFAAGFTVEDREFDAAYMDVVGKVRALVARLDD